MSDKAEKKPDAGAADKEKKGGEKKGGGLLTKMPILLGGAMVIEAVVLFAGFKFLGGGAPKPASAAETTTEGKEGESGAAKPAEKKKTVEVPVLDLRAQNSVSGRSLLFDVSIVIVVKGEAEDSVKAKVADSTAMIKDRISTIIRVSDPQKLGGGSEPGLETLRRQVKSQLDQILGEGTIEEVLVPRCIPFRADY